ncbi:hypothetical protein [Amycolatopsis thermalba]|uniref:hypothetical protein n=1 Tax=Amycolatopsis thermalba TaxID=944492 RepID=UPI001F076B96|nr:hypothetical protein [Amycolatopsis thermalba]
MPRERAPSPAEAARLVEKAFALHEDWGTLVWLVMTTGIRRGEACALRWSRVDLDEGIIEIRRSYTKLRGVGQEKDTKTGSGCGAVWGTVSRSVFLARHAGLRSGGMGTVSDDIWGCDST